MPPDDTEIPVKANEYLHLSRFLVIIVLYSFTHQRKKNLIVALQVKLRGRLSTSGWQWITREHFSIVFMAVCSNREDAMKQCSCSKGTLVCVIYPSILSLVTDDSSEKWLFGHFYRISWWRINSSWRKTSQYSPLKDIDKQTNQLLEMHIRLESMHIRRATNEI